MMKFYIFKNKQRKNLAHSLGIGHIKCPPTVVPEGGGQMLDQGSYLSTGLERGPPTPL